MLFIAFLSVIVWLCSADPTTIEEMEEIQKMCQEEHGISEEMFIEMRRREMILEDENDEPRRCIIECLLLGFGLIKDGQVDVTTVMNIATPMLENIQKEQGREIDEDELKDDIARCSDALTDETTNCTTSYETWKCLHEAVSKVMVHPSKAE